MMDNIEFRVIGVIAAISGFCLGFGFGFYYFIIALNTPVGF